MSDIRAQVGAVYKVLRNKPSPILESPPALSPTLYFYRGRSDFDAKEAVTRRNTFIKPLRNISDTRAKEVEES